MTGGAGGSAGPSSAEAGAYGSSLGQDNSGWAVNFSGLQSAASSQDKSSGGGLSGLAGSVPWYVWAAAAAGVVLWRFKKSRR